MQQPIIVVQKASYPMNGLDDPSDYNFLILCAVLVDIFSLFGLPYMKPVYPNHQLEIFIWFL